MIEVVGRKHLGRHRLARKLGQGAGGGDHHGLGDGPGASVEGAAKDVGETQHVVDLVGVIGTAGRHEGVIARGVDVGRRDLRIGVGHGEQNRARRHPLHHVLRHQIRAGHADEDVGVGHRLGQGTQPGVAGEFLLVRVEVGAAGVDDAPGIDQQHVFLLAAHRDQEPHAGEAGGAGAEADQLDVSELFLLHVERIEQAGAHHHGGAVLIVVKDRDVEALFQRLLDDEAVRCGDVFQVDAAEGGRDVDYCLNEAFHAGRLDLDVEHVDVAETLEQHALTFHHRLAGERAEIAQAEDGGAVGDYRHQVALVGVAVGVGRVFRDGAHRFRHAGGVGQREVGLGGAGFGGIDRDLTGPGKLVIGQGAGLQITGGGFRFGVAHRR